MGSYRITNSLLSKSSLEGESKAYCKMDRYTTTLCVREIFTLEKRVFHIKMKSFHRAETVRQFSCRSVQWRQ